MPKQNWENSSLCNSFILLQNQFSVIKIQNTGQLQDNINMYISSNSPQKNPKQTRDSDNKLQYTTEVNEKD